MNEQCFFHIHNLKHSSLSSIDCLLIEARRESHFWMLVLEGLKFLSI